MNVDMFANRIPLPILIIYTHGLPNQSDDRLLILCVEIDEALSSPALCSKLLGESKSGLVLCRLILPATRASTW